MRRIRRKSFFLSIVWTAAGEGTVSRVHTSIPVIERTARTARGKAVGRRWRSVLPAPTDLCRSDSGGRLLCGDSPDGLVWAIGADDTVLVANLDRRDRRVELESPDGGRVLVEVTAGSWRRIGL